MGPSGRSPSDGRLMSAPTRTDESNRKIADRKTLHAKTGGRKVRTPLAWKNLAVDRRRLALASAGVAFACVLMFMQNGFRNALLDSPVQWVRMLRCDLVAVSRARYALPAEQSFPRRLLERAAGDVEVVATASLPVERVRALVRVVGEPRRPIRTIGVPLEPSWFADGKLRRDVERLRMPKSAIVDSMSRREYGFRLDDAAALAKQAVELSGREVRLVGTVAIGTDFANEGTLLVSESEFARYFPFRGEGDPLGQTDLGLFRLRAGAEAGAVARRLTAIAPREWEVVPRQDLIDREIAFWGGQTPIGMIFLIGVMMGFAVGVIICYQVLYAGIQDAMPEFATLKAMGYPNRYFVALVVRQSVYLAVLGFIPGVILSFALFRLLEAWAGLPMLITFPRASLVLTLTVLMCLASGLLALRKLLRADPASLF